MKSGDEFKKECVLFTYSTKHMSSSDKVRFHYSLKGRNKQQGLLKTVDGKHLGSTVLLIPKEQEAYVDEYFAVWNIPYKKHSIILQDELINMEAIDEPQ